MTVKNYFVMTDYFSSHYSGDTTQTLQDAADYCESNWPFSDSSDYAAEFYAESSTILDIDYDWYSQQPLLYRRDKALEWLNNENPSWWSSCDSVIVLDYIWENGHEGWARTGHAISEPMRGGIVDYAYEGSLNWSTPIHNVTFHELVHTYAPDSSDHQDGTIYNDDTASLMTSWEESGPVEYGCYNYGTDGKTSRIDFLSFCTENNVKCKIDNPTITDPGNC